MKAKRLLLLLTVLGITFASFGRDVTGSWFTSQAGIPITGIPVPGMASFDNIISDLMTRWQIPGGAVAVVKDGRLVLAHGYGYADKEANQSVQPDSLFRIASLSKQITSAAVLKLVEEGKLSLDAKAFSFIDLQPPQGASVDGRIRDITIRQLLQHSGGWDRYKTFDPMFIPIQAAYAVGAPAPASAETVIRYMLGQPLQFAPGTEYQYSNFGYCVLGRIIEKVSGQSYEDYVRTHVLNPARVTSMRLGHTLLADRAEREVRYYDFPGAGLAQSAFPNTPSPVPWPYGGFYIEAMDAHGGWIASTVDLMRFLTAVDGRNTRPDILQPATISLMVSRPAPPLWVGSSYYYGMGWFVRPIDADANWWHSGSLPGTSAFTVRSYNGLAWVALFNSRPSDQDNFFSQLDNALWQAVNGVTDWPTHDLFGDCTYSISPISQSFSSTGGAGSVNVTASAGCAWTAASNASWITVTSSSSGNGNGNVNYSVLPNVTGSARGGSITIAGQTFAVAQQAPVTPDFALGFGQSTVSAEPGTKAPVTVTITRTGGFTGNVTVTPPFPGSGIKPKPSDPITTTGDSATFKFKMGAGTPVGSYQLTFKGIDDSGRSRTATLSLIVGAQNDAWQIKAPMPTARMSARAAVISGLLYVVGGINGGRALATLDVYDPSTNSWSARAPLPTTDSGDPGRYDGAVGVINGEIYVAGGYDNDRGATSSLFVYSPVSNTWSSRAQMPILSALSAGGVINGKLYVLTGDNGRTFTKLLHVYDPSTNTWAAKAPPTYGLSFPSFAEVIDGKLYVVAGGNNGYSVFVYDPVSDAWTVRAPMLTPRTGAAGGVIGGKLYVAGGYDAGWSSVLEVYDPLTNTWTSRAPMSQAREVSAGAVIGGSFYVVGGWYGTVLDTLEVYTTAGPSSIALSSNKLKLPVTDMAGLSPFVRQSASLFVR